MERSEFINREAAGIQTENLDKNLQGKKEGFLMNRRTFIKAMGGLATVVTLPEIINAESQAKTSNGKERSRESETQFNYDYDLFEQIYMHGADMNKLPKVPHEQLWWFDNPMAPRDFASEKEFIDALMTKSKIAKEPFLPILQCFYAFPILMEKNSRLSGEALKTYFQSQGDTFDKIIKQLNSAKGEIDISTFQDLDALMNASGIKLKKDELQRMIAENDFGIDNLTKFATAFFKALPLHMLDYIERIDDSSSVLHLRFNKPDYQLNIKIKKQLINELLGGVISFPVPDVEGKIKWEQDVYIDFKVLDTKAEHWRTDPNNPMCLDKKTVLFKNIRGVSMSVPFTDKVLGSLATGGAKALGLMDVSLSEMLNAANYYLAFVPEENMYADTADEIKVLKNINISSGLPNKKASLPVNKMSIKDISYDGKGSPYVALGSEGELLESIESYAYIYGRDQTQRFMRAMILFSPMQVIHDRLNALARDESSNQSIKSELQEIEKKVNIEIHKDEETRNQNVTKIFEKVFDFNLKDMLQGSSHEYTLRIKKDAKNQDIARLRHLLEIMSSQLKNEPSDVNSDFVKFMEILLQELNTGRITNLNDYK